MFWNKTEVKHVGKTNSQRVVRKYQWHAKREASMKDGVSNFEKPGVKCVFVDNHLFKYRKTNLYDLIVDS